MLQRLSSFLCLFALLAFSSADAAKKTEITMGFNPAENVDAVEMNGKAFSDFYEKKTGIKIKSFVATDYTALIEALRAGRIDFAWLPPFSYVKAEELADAKVLLKAVRHGHATFFSCIISRSDKGISKVADLKGKNMAWVDPTSTSGHIFPKANLMSKFHIEDPDKFFAKQIFAGSHDSLVLSVFNGTVDAGATFCNNPDGSDGAWNLYLKTPEDQKRIKVVYVTDPITGDTMATTNKFYKENAALVDELTKVLIDMGKLPEGKKILDALYHMEGLVPAKSADYDPIRKAAKILKIE